MTLELKLDRPLVVFDIESTGVNPRNDRIIELAAVKLHPDGAEETKTWLLNPTVPIPPETTAIHGISDDIVKDCPTFRDKADEIFDFFRGCDLSGFNADRFDIPCIEEEFARVGRNFAASQRRHVDVQRIYHRMEPRDLSSAVRFYLGRDHAGAHGAEADAKATVEVLKAQIERYGELQNDVDFLADFSSRGETADYAGRILYNEKGEEVFGFGKYKGRSVADVFRTEPSYYDWMMNGDFPLYTKKVITEIRLRDKK